MTHSRRYLLLVASHTTGQNTVEGKKGATDISTAGRSEVPKTALKQIKQSPVVRTDSVL